MESWGERFPAIGDVRGLGAMLAIELVADRVTKTPAPELAIKVIDEARARGLLLLRAGVYSNCVRVLVPLTVSDNVLSEALDVFAAALAAALDESSRERGSATSASLAV
jgi:4-aminobutyrate aminotransferase/(S)-3-amino-2-methylpropionate transaminase